MMIIGWRCELGRGGGAQRPHYEVQGITVHTVLVDVPSAVWCALLVRGWLVERGGRGGRQPPDYKSNNITLQ
jgi:hypothetical protein